MEYPFLVYCSFFIQKEAGIGCITYGGYCEQDIELICDAWGVEAEDPYDINSLLKAAYESCEN